MDPMQLFVQYGRSIRAMGVPKRLRFGSYSQKARPHPWSWPTDVIVFVMPLSSSQAAPLRS